jgi:Kef-type K+ transport system membrane component KefB
MSDPKQLWQNQNGERTSMTIEELREKLRTLQSKTRWWMIVNSIIGLTCLAVFISIFIKTTVPDGRWGWGLVIVGTLCIMVPTVSLAFKGGLPQTFEADAALTTSLEFYRRILDRQRTLRLPGNWTALGLFFLFAGLFVMVAPIALATLQRPSPSSLNPWIPFAMILVAWGISYILIGRRTRAWFRREYEALDALEKKGGNFQEL